ncbi:MAG: four-carbon acid sugar kinase family protein, partial [Cyanobium sp.]
MAEVSANPKIIVLDDDPTGSQTVHGCPLLLRWDAASLAAGLRQPSPLLFLLANTRALAADAAAARVRQICRGLKPALAEAQASGMIGDWLVVSRGDSTLRGHCPLEAEILAEELGPFAATLLVPAFPEGGRTTLAAVHR